MCKFDDWLKRNSPFLNNCNCLSILPLKGTQSCCILSSFESYLIDSEFDFNLSYFPAMQVHRSRASQVISSVGMEDVLKIPGFVIDIMIVLTTMMKHPHNNVCFIFCFILCCFCMLYHQFNFSFYVPSVQVSYAYVSII